MVWENFRAAEENSINRSAESNCWNIG